jgi:hypothetical protein
MPSETNSRSWSTRIGAALGLGLTAVLLSQCGGTAQFPLREPVTVDNDKRPFSPAPEEYESPFAWDAANQTIFRPVARFFAVDPAGRATNANAFDEVPDSSWFENRMGKVDIDADAVRRGGCEGPQLDPKGPDGSWVIDKGKDNGANPGFRVNVPGVGKFMLKSDLAEEPERATGATAIASRVYYTMGYFAPCDTIVYFPKSLLKLTPGLKITNNQGRTRPFDDAALEKILSGASHRDGLIRMVASSWLPGKPLGPYTYDGHRSDDPNDVIPHEDRRELRAARLVAAWLNHFDSREQNSMDVFMATNEKDKKSPGYVRHYIIDLGDSFGSVWSVDGFSRLFDNAYMFDVGYITEDFVTFGAVERPWERKKKVGGVFNYFSARYFDPEMWRGEYPNPAFSRMTEEDGAWIARILARFDDSLVAAAVGVGKFDDAASRYLTATLIQRRTKILKRYLTRLSPIGGLTVKDGRLCGVDLARRANLIDGTNTTFSGRFYRGEDLEQKGTLQVNVSPDASFCTTLPQSAPERAPGDSLEKRYVVVELMNGQAPGPLRAHLYDLGPSQGFRLVGIDRPSKPGTSLPTH